MAGRPSSYIGASEAAALVGEHPFLTMSELAVEKLAGAPVRDDTSAMRSGRHLEPAVASWWEDEHGALLVEPDELYVYDDALVATLDRPVVGTAAAVEIKTTNRYVDELQRSWYWQCQVQMLCADLDHVEVVVLDPSMELKSFIVEPDDEDQALIVEAATKFLHHVRAGEAPPDVELTYRAASALHPAPEVAIIELDDETLRWCRSLGRAGAHQELAGRRGPAQGMLAHRLGDAAEGHRDGELVCTWREVIRHDIDRKRLRAKHPGIAQECTSESRYRQLRLVTPKEKKQ